MMEIVEQDESQTAAFTRIAEGAQGWDGVTDPIRPALPRLNSKDHHAMSVAGPIEDRLAIQDVLVAYANAVDHIGNIEGVLDVFVEDAVFDLSRHRPVRR
jgi:hypothetical protein